MFRTNLIILIGGVFFIFVILTSIQFTVNAAKSSGGYWVIKDSSGTVTGKSDCAGGSCATDPGNFTRVYVPAPGGGKSGGGDDSGGGGGSAPAPCQPVALACTATCGQIARCASNGCGGQSCCPATAACVPTPTPNCSLLLPKGDANCDQVVNSLDFDIFKAQLQSYGNSIIVDFNPKANSDFNSDKKVSVLDFEIWRNTFLK
ncbi:MAG: dockerin type I domain-containing protein [Candidatus Roizmanbacteria bacterium]|nr:dockerin type I domain-containing protein [Candidatus Roizmanbacteria bacterium]